MTEQGAHDELAARLDVALHERLGESSVDVAALAAGSKRRARRVRTQRVGALTGALALLIAVPVGWQLATAERPTDMQGAVLLPKQEDRAAAEVPESVGFTASELPPGSTLTGAAAGASSGSVNPELIDGLNCAGPTGTAKPGATDNAQQREWRWSGETEVSLTVTRWGSTDAAADALTTLANSTGGCTWNEPVEVLPHEVSGSDQTLASNSTAGERSVVRVLVRVDELVAGVQIADRDPETAAELAESLAEVEVEKLRSLG